MKKDPYEVLDLKALRCFYFVAKHHSVTRAASELGIAGPAVTQRVQKLEEELGGLLFQARGGRIQLTPAGQHALSFATNLFDDIQNFERSLTQAEEAAEIVVSAHDAILGYLLADVIEKFKRVHPLAKLTLRVRRIDDTIREVRMNEADLGIVPQREIPDELFSRPIGTWRACLLTAKGHPVARYAQADFRSILNEEMMRRYPLIILEEQKGGGVFEETFARIGLRPNVGMEVGSLDTLKRFVARGIGVGAVPEVWVMDEDRLRLDVVPVPPELEADTTYWVVMRRDKHKGRLLKDLLDLLGNIPTARSPGALD